MCKIQSSVMASLPQYVACLFVQGSYVFTLPRNKAKEAGATLQYFTHPVLLIIARETLLLNSPSGHFQTK